LVGAIDACIGATKCTSPLITSNTYKPRNDRWPKQPQPAVPLHVDAGVRAEGATLTTRPSGSSERYSTRAEAKKRSDA
jgi:hypothetical protein